MKVTRVTKVEFETEDGAVYPITPPLEKDMTPEEFQEHYDRASNFIASCKDIGGLNPNPEKLEH